jgi:hypothetical protein
MVDKSAIAPSNVEFLKFIRKEREDEKPGKFTKEDEDIALLSSLDGWRLLKEFMLKRKAKLLELKDFDLKGADYEEMGKLFYFARLVGEEIDAIINKVEVTRRVVDGE